MWLNTFKEKSKDITEDELNKKNKIENYKISQ